MDSEEINNKRVCFLAALGQLIQSLDQFHTNKDIVACVHSNTFSCDTKLKKDSCIKLELPLFKKDLRYLGFMNAGDVPLSLGILIMQKEDARDLDAKSDSIIRTIILSDKIYAYFPIITDTLKTAANKFGAAPTINSSEEITFIFNKNADFSVTFCIAISNNG